MHESDGSKKAVVPNRIDNKATLLLIDQTKKNAAELDML